MENSPSTQAETMVRSRGDALASAFFQGFFRYAYSQYGFGCHFNSKLPRKLIIFLHLKLSITIVHQISSVNILWERVAVKFFLKLIRRYVQHLE